MRVHRWLDHTPFYQGIQSGDTFLVLSRKAYYWVANGRGQKILKINGGSEINGMEEFTMKYSRSIIDKVNRSIISGRIHQLGQIGVFT